MKSTIFRIFLIACTLGSSAFAQDAKQMHETAKNFMKQGDYANAIIVLNRAIEMEPKNIGFSKDLALSFYFNQDFNKSLAVIKPLLDRDDTDDQTFQVAGNIYKSMNMPKEAEKTYKNGLKKFPESGALYNELGEILWAQKNNDAIKEWEKGIEKDPSYPKNYFNAAKFYSLTADKIWSILYGEIFLNMEPFSNRSPEIKDILLESHKKLFMETNLQNVKDRNRFESAYLQSMNRQTAVAGGGINPETLTMIRTRFILDWFNESKRPAFKLFDFHRQLLQEGLFEAYNQWIFGSAQNLTTFQNWINAHPEEYAAFNTFQKSRVFRIPNGEYYPK